MIFLQNIQALVNSLLNRLTATRAGYLDNLTDLDAAISTRASASALTNLDTDVGTLLTRLSDTRAAYLDQPLSETGIKSVQSGTAALSTASSTTSVTISSIDTSKAFLIFSHVVSTSGTDPRFINLRGSIAGATTLQFYRYSWSSVSGSVAWQVVEFF